MKILITLSSLLLASTSLLAANGLDLNKFTIKLKRLKELKLSLEVLKKNKVLTITDFEIPLGHSHHLVKIEAVKNSKNYFIIDYFKGYQGTKSVSACFEAYLFKINKQGKLKQISNLEYRCDQSAAKGFPQNDSFSNLYQIKKKGDSYQIVFKRF